MVHKMQKVYRKVEALLEAKRVCSVEIMSWNQGEVRPQV